MSWKRIATFDPDFGNPPLDVNILAGGDQSTVEERQTLINDAHAKGTHHFWYCGVNSCKSVALSHQTDHKLCRPTFCDSIKNLHYHNNHGTCNAFWCNDKSWMDKSHSEGSHHELFCTPESCDAIARSHMTDHTLCRPRHCGFIKFYHNDHMSDHHLCAEYWCDYKQNIIREDQIQKLHNADDHSRCPRRINSFMGCSTIIQNHSQGIHSMCSHLTCPDGKEIDAAHAQGEHSDACTRGNCYDPEQAFKDKGARELKRKFQDKLDFWTELDRAAE